MMRTQVLVVLAALAVVTVGCDALEHDMMSERNDGLAAVPAGRASTTPRERLAEAVADHHTWMIGASGPEDTVQLEDAYQHHMRGMMGGMMGAWPRQAAIGDELERHGTAMAEVSTPAERTAEEIRHHEAMMGLVDEGDGDDDRYGHM